MSYYYIQQLRPASLDLSIIIPLKNEDESVAALAGEIGTVMQEMNITWECLWVDDGSTDGTLEILKKSAAINSHHQYISFDKNYGQSAAFTAGFAHARGRILVTMDGDGQNDPADIPMLVSDLITNDYDLVQGWRKNRKDSLTRKISSKIGNAYRNKITGDSIRDVGCSMRAMKRECVENLIVFKGLHRFLPTMVRINDFRNISEIPVNHRPRLKGQTKTGLATGCLSESKILSRSGGWVRD